MKDVPSDLPLHNFPREFSLLNDRGQKAMQGQGFDFDPYTAAEDALRETNEYHFIKDRGRASEAASRAVVGDGAISLDTVAKEVGGYSGGKYPTFDIASPHELSSVKTHYNMNGELDESAVRRYISNFRNMISEEKLGAKADDILKIRDAGFTVPTDLQKADRQQAISYIRDKTLLRIPDDHVEKIRERIRQLQEDGLISPHQADNWCHRVQGIGITSTQLDELLSTKYST